MKKAIVLGGTVPHCQLITKLKNRGYYVILIDYTSNPPAKEYADEHIKESTLDKEIVLRIAKENRVSLVISTCVDQANVVCCYVADKLGLPKPYSYETALNVTDKTKMKKIMWDSNIPTSKYVYVENLDGINNLGLKYPVMVKPADSNSANGVKKAANYLELCHYLPEALRYSRNGKVIVEEHISGMEISVYCVVVDKMAKVIMTQERISTYDGTDKVIKCYAAHAPARISQKVKEKVVEIATNIAQAFNLDNTPLFFQGIVENDQVSVIEFAPRVGGGISSQTMTMATNYDIIDAAIDSFLGKKIAVTGLKKMTQVYAVNQLYGNAGIYKCTIGHEELLKNKDIDLISFYKKSGDKIDPARASSSRVGVIVVHGDNDSHVVAKIKKAIDSIDILDECDKSIIRRDLLFREV